MLARRTRLLLLVAFGLAVGFFVLLLRTPPSTNPEQAPPPTAGIEQSAGCFEALIRVDTVHLRCDHQAGTVTIDGKFLTRLATHSLDTAVLSAVVTVRTASGEILYSARDSFAVAPGRVDRARESQA